MLTPAATLDQAIGFTITQRHARGRLVRLGPVLDAVLAAHAYPPAIERTLASALVLAALLGSTLKEEGGQLTLQAQTDNGVISLLVADYKNGDLRGYAKFDAERLAELGPDPSLFGLFGKGFLAITFDLAETGERYQGIVPLEGESLADAAEHYFFQSEQIPSLIRIATRHDTGEGCVAAGLLLQHLPEGEGGEGGGRGGVLDESSSVVDEALQGRREGERLVEGARLFLDRAELPERVGVKPGEPVGRATVFTLQALILQPHDPLDHLLLEPQRGEVRPASRLPFIPKVHP